MSMVKPVGGVALFVLLLTGSKLPVVEYAPGTEYEETALAAVTSRMANEGFDRVFQKRQRIDLDQPYGKISALVGDGQENVWLFDYENVVLKKYSRTGRLLLRLTKLGAAEHGQDVFGVVGGLACDSHGNLYIASSTKRITVLNSDGHYLRSFVVTTPALAAPLSLALDEQRGILYVSGALNSSGQVVHKYRIEDWKYLGAFLDIPTEVQRKNLINYNTSFIDTDIRGKVFATHQVVHQLFRYDPISQKVQAFSGQSGYYRAPPDLSQVAQADLFKQQNQWSRLGRVWVIQHRVVVAILQPSPAKYLLELYSLDGRLLVTDLTTPLTPVGRDAGGHLYFYDEDHPIALLQYKMN
jgi:hypothetical protein